MKIKNLIITNLSGKSPEGETISNENTVCTACSVCQSGQYSSSGCSGTQNSVCSICSSCSSGEYRSNDCNGTSRTLKLLNTPFTIQRNYFLRNIYLEKDFEVSFDIKPISTLSGWRNILRVTNTN